MGLWKQFTTHASGTFSGSFYGVLAGSIETASFAESTAIINAGLFEVDPTPVVHQPMNMDTASYAITASYALAVLGDFVGNALSASYADSSSYAYTASHARNAEYLDNQLSSFYRNASNINAGTLNNAYLPSQINQTGFTGSFTGSLIGTSSWADNSGFAITAETANTANAVAFANITGKPTLVSSSAQVNSGSFTGSFIGSASWATAAGVALDVDYARVSNKPTLISSSAQVNSGSFTGSFIGSASWATAAGVALDVDYARVSNKPTLVSSSAQVNSGSFTGSFIGTSSFASNAGNAILLSGQNSAYYTNASNINAGTLANTYLPSQINQTGFTGSFTGTLAGLFTGTSSYGETAGTVKSITDDSTNATRYPTFINAQTGQQQIATDVSLTYNPSTNVLTATSSQATNASTLGYQNSAYYTNASNINAGTLANTYLPAQINQTGFTGSFRGNVFGTSSVANIFGGQSSSYYLNASNINAGTLANTYLPAQISQTGFTGSFTGTLAGLFTGTSSYGETAGTIKSITDDSTNATRYPTFINAQTGQQQVATDVSLTYNPSTNTMTVTASQATNASTLGYQNSAYYLNASNINAGTLANTYLPAQINQTGFTGSFTGTFTGLLSNASASFATTASFGREASYLQVQTDDSTAATRYPTFVQAQTGQQSQYTDVSLTYNPSTNVLTATASQATNAATLGYQNSAYYTNASNINAGTIANTYLPSQINQTGFSGSFTGSFIGSASFASNAGNSILLGGQNSAYYTNASNINAGTIANTYLPAQINQTGFTGSFRGNVFGTASSANTLAGQSASYYTNASNINAGTLANTYLPSQINQTGFTGSFTGTLAGLFTGTSSYATTAGTIDARTDGTNASRYVSFLIGQTGQQQTYTDAGLTYNPSTNALTTTTFIGALQGNADTATTAGSATNATNATNIAVSAENTTAATRYVTFVDAQTGNNGAKTDSSLTYNPSTNVLTTSASQASNATQLDYQNSSFYRNASNINAGTIANTYLPAQINQTGFTGSFTGTLNGLFTGTSSYADTAGTIKSLTDGANASRYVSFLIGQTGQQQTYTDAGLTYNPSSNALTTTTFIGALQGNADTATTATNATNIAVQADNTTAATRYVVFVDAQTGNNAAKTDTGLIWNPSTDTLGITTSQFAGTASFATNTAGGSVGPGTVNRVAKFQTATTLTDATIYDDGSQVTSSVPFRAQAGSAGTPAFAFAAENNSGIYGRTAGGEVNITTAGTQRLQVSSTAISSSVPFYGPVGSSTGPTYTFAGDTNCGMYSALADVLQFTTNGTQRFQISTTFVSSSLPIYAQDGTATTPAYTFASDTNTGIYSNAADVLKLVAGGADRVRIDTTALSSSLVARVADGTAAVPAYSFGSDTNTGMYSDAADYLKFSTAGSERWRITPSGHLSASSDGVYDIGAAAAGRPANVYIAFDAYGRDARFNSGTFAGPVTYGYMQGNTANFLVSVTGSKYVGNEMDLILGVSGTLYNKGTQQFSVDNTYDIGTTSVRARTIYAGAMTASVAGAYFNQATSTLVKPILKLEDSSRTVQAWFAGTPQNAVLNAFTIGASHPMVFSVGYPATGMMDRLRINAKTDAVALYISGAISASATTGPSAVVGLLTGSVNVSGAVNPTSIGATTLDGNMTSSAAVTASFGALIAGFRAVAPVGTDMWLT